MKKITILTLFTGISFLVHSQVKQEYKHYQKGQNQISTTLPRINVIPGSFQLHANLRYGHFIKDKWLIGIETKASVSYFDQSLGIGAYSRYYLSNKKISPFVGLGVYSRKTWQDNLRIEPNQQYVKSSMQSIDAEVGVAYWFNKRVGIELALRQPTYYKGLKNGFIGGVSYTHTKEGFHPLTFSPEFRINFNF